MACKELDTLSAHHLTVSDLPDIAAMTVKAFGPILTNSEFRRLITKQASLLQALLLTAGTRQRSYLVLSKEQPKSNEASQLRLPVAS